MASDTNEQHSKAHAPVLITDPDKLAAHEARNGLRQFDETQALIDEFLNTDRPFKLRPSMLLMLHRTALDGISLFAGNFRPAGIEIEGSDHEPVEAYLVPEHIEYMCEYINDNWKECNAIHLAAYAMWRLNWIHPFDDGNGRTSRAISYLVLCVKAGFQLPGTNTIPEQIASNKAPYYDALEAADKKYLNGQEINLAELETYLEGLLANQLLEVFNSAKGGLAGNNTSTPKFH